MASSRSTVSQVRSSSWASRWLVTARLWRSTAAPFVGECVPGSPRPVRVAARPRRGRGGRCAADDAVPPRGDSGRRRGLVEHRRLELRPRPRRPGRRRWRPDVASAASAVATAAVASARRAAVTGCGLLGDEEVSLGLGKDRREPLRHLAPPGRARRRAWHRLSEGAALRRCGDVGPVDGEDGFEDVAGFGHVVAVGDDTQRVGVAAAGGSDIQAAAGGGWGGEGDGGVDGVGLPAVLGGGVAEPHMIRR